MKLEKFLLKQERSKSEPRVNPEKSPKMEPGLNSEKTRISIFLSRQKERDAMTIPARFQKARRSPYKRDTGPLLP